MVIFTCDVASAYLQSDPFPVTVASPTAAFSRSGLPWAALLPTTVNSPCMWILLGDDFHGLFPTVADKPGVTRWTWLSEPQLFSPTVPVPTLRAAFALGEKLPLLDLRWKSCK